MNKNLFILLVAILSFGFTQAQTTTKREHVVKDVKAQAVGAQRGASKIVNDVPTTDIALPPSESCGGCYSKATFDNYTGYWIKVYVDGDFKGSVEPWGTGSCDILSSWQSWYCETSGGTLSWEGKSDGGSDLWVNLRE